MLHIEFEPRRSQKSDYSVLVAQNIKHLLLAADSALVATLLRNLQSRCFIFFARATGVCGFIFAQNPGQKVYLNGANFWPILGFSGSIQEAFGLFRTENVLLTENLR